MDIQVLSNELVTDELSRGYAGMTDQEAADDLNSVYRSRDVAIMASTQVINLIDKSEWDVRTTEQKQVVWNLLHMGDVNPHGMEADLFQEAMAGATNTLAALNAARVESISRAVELDLGFVRPGDVDAARHYGE